MSDRVKKAIAAGLTIALVIGFILAIVYLPVEHWLAG